jgi:hypothetical protein
METSDLEQTTYYIMAVCNILFGDVFVRCSPKAIIQALRIFDQIISCFASTVWFDYAAVWSWSDYSELPTVEYCCTSTGEYLYYCSEWLSVTMFRCLTYIHLTVRYISRTAQNAMVCDMCVRWRTAQSVARHRTIEQSEWSLRGGVVCRF